MRRDILPRERYMMDSIFTTRGCPNNCRFCPVTPIFGPQIRHRPIDEVIAEINTLRKRYFNVDDSVFGHPQIVDRPQENQYYFDLYTELATLRPKRLWGGAGGLSAINYKDGRKIIELAAEGGLCSIAAGLESISGSGQKQSGAWRKLHFTSSDTFELQALKENIRIIQDLGIEIMGFFIVGWDEDTLDTYQRTLEFCDEMKLIPFILTLVPMPGSQIYDEYHKEGRIINDLPWTGMSALQFQRQLGIKRYETAFLMLHKLRAAMVRPGRDRIGAKWPVEVDETYVGGATQGEGRGQHHKTLVVGMVEVLPRKKALGPDPNLPSGQRPQHRGGHGRGFIAGRLRLQVVPNRKQETLEPMVLNNVQTGAEVRTDGWTGYDNLHKLGYRHTAVPVRGDQAKADQHLPMIHIVFGNLDAWLLGTHHGVSSTHLQGYLNEFVFRFNRRFWPMVAFDSVLKIAAQVESLTYRDFYESEQTHTNPPDSDEPVLTG